LTDNKKVIVLMAQVAPWTLWDYVSPAPAKRNAVADWYRKTLSIQAKADFEALLRGLAKTDSPDKWPGWKGYMHGKQIGLWHIGFKADKRQYRVIGMMAPEGRKRALLLIGYYHKQGRYVPDGALDTAVQRKKKLENGEASLDERKV
jgi:hypothetical protein